MHYSFMRIHKTLQVTLAAAAGLVPSGGELAVMVQVRENWQATRS